MIATILAWKWTANWQRRHGRELFYAHFFGAIAGMIGFFISMTLIVVTDPNAGNHSDNLAKTPASIENNSVQALGKLKPTESIIANATPKPSKTEQAINKPIPKSDVIKPKTSDDSVKAKVISFEKQVHDYDTVSSIAMSYAKYLAEHLTDETSRVNLYKALKEAEKYSSASATLTLKIEIKDDLPEAVAKALDEARESAFQMFTSRRKALEEFMEWVDDPKPSHAAAMQEHSDFSSLQASQLVIAIAKAKKEAGFTDKEIESSWNEEKNKPKPHKHH